MGSQAPQCIHGVEIHCKKCAAMLKRIEDEEFDHDDDAEDEDDEEDDIGVW
jgi:hypothetical protein